MVVNRRSFVFHACIILMAFAMIYPLLWTVASSLKPNAEVFVNASSLIPSSLQWSNYSSGWRGFGNTGFDVFFLNSAIITLLTVAGTLFSSSLTAFGFARLRFPLKSALFACLIVSMMLPMQVTLIPQYILFFKLGWVNTFLPLIVPAFIGGVPFFIFLVMQFIRGIPKELDDSAVIDGCTKLQFFGFIILPLLKPALATAAIFSFYWTWDDFLSPLIYLNSVNLYTVSLGLQMFADPGASTNWSQMFAMSVLSLVPQLFIFLFCQKYIVDGIATTGIKG